MTASTHADEKSLRPLLAAIAPDLLQGRSVLVTGAARGLGLSFAKAITAAGASVVMADMLEDLVKKEAQKLCAEGHSAKGLAVDLSNLESITACADAAVAAFGRLDGLDNNAAITNPGGRNAHLLEIDMWDHVMQVNVRGTWLMSRAVHAALKCSGQGAIVNLASDTALWGAPNLLAYAASKGAVISVTRSLSREWGGDHITVNSVAPGLTLVEATEYVPQALHEKYLEGRALQREQQAADVCGAVVFSLSGLARFVTGQLLAVNGGFVMH